jgi:competence ComEA-like helix-hairpin-helix protein
MPSPFSNLDARLGITRGDLTILLFVTATALAGFIYTSFFDSRPPLAEQKEMEALVHRHDSIVAVRRNARLTALRGTIAAPSDSSSGSSPRDSLPAWTPLTADDAERDAIAEKAGKPASSSGKKGAPSAPVNINAAPRDALMKLPGVGEKTAEAIIAMRAHVPFRRPEDIMNVKGIGEKKFEKMKAYIVVK